MSKSFFIFLTVLLSFSLYGQQEKIDSFHHIALHAPNDSILNDALHQISVIYSNTQPDSGLYYAWKCYDLSIKNGWKKQVTTAFSQVGYSYMIMNVIDSAVLYWDKAAEGYGELEDMYRQTIILNNIAGMLVNVGKYNDAKTYLEKAETIAEKMKSLDLLSGIYVSYGLIDDYKGNYDRAYKLYSKALEYADSIGSERQRMNVLNNIGVMFYYMGDYRKAISYFQKVLPYWKIEHKSRKISEAYKNLGVSYDLLNQNDSALYYHNLALETDIILDDRYNQGKDHHNIGVIYEKTNQNQLALKHFSIAEKFKEESGISESLGNTYHYLGKLYLKAKQYTLAAKYLQKSEAVAIELESKEQLKDNAQLQAQYHEAVGNFKQSLTYQRKYQVYKDSLYEVEKVKTINDIETKYKTKETKQESLLLSQKLGIEEANNARKNAYLLALVTASLSMLFVTGFFYRQYRTKDMLNKTLTKRNTQVQTLIKGIAHQTKGQLNFATNLLGIQKAMVKEKSAKSALQDSENWFRALTTVNKYLNYNEEESSSMLKKSLTEIAENLKFSNEMLLNKNVTVQLNLPSIQTNTDNAIWMAIIVNELFTNSYKHAFDTEPNPIIELTIEPSNDKMVTLLYRDNGVGYKPHSSKQGGDGLSIIKDMVEQLNGSYQKQIENGFHFEAKFPNFTI